MRNRINEAKNNVAIAYEELNKVLMALTVDEANEAVRGYWSGPAEFTIETVRFSKFSPYSGRIIYDCTFRSETNSTVRKGCLTVWFDIFRNKILADLSV